MKKKSTSSKLTRKFKFIEEIDKLKLVERQTVICKGVRHENSAEHSWHLAIMMMVFSDLAPKKMNLLKAIKMLLLHDLVEIDAGDTFAYDTTNMKTQDARERKAAKRIFGILPKKQAQEFHSLWLEFEATKSREAKFAKSMDRLQPILQNYQSGGHAWQKHGVKKSQVIARNKKLIEASPELWSHTKKVIDLAVSKKFLRDD